MLLLDMLDFGAWLCEREAVIVGQAGTWFHSPLSLYLQDRTGHLYGIDGSVYGLAAGSERCWELPCWAKRFYALLERQSTALLTGRDAFEVLALVECK